MAARSKVSSRRIFLSFSALIMLLMLVVLPNSAIWGQEVTATPTATIAPQFYLASNLAQTYTWDTAAQGPRMPAFFTDIPEVWVGVYVEYSGEDWKRMACSEAPPLTNWECDNWSKAWQDTSDHNTGSGVRCFVTTSYQGITGANICAAVAPGVAVGASSTNKVVSAGSDVVVFPFANAAGVYSFTFIPILYGTGGNTPTPTPVYTSTPSFTPTETETPTPTAIPTCEPGTGLVISEADGGERMLSECLLATATAPPTNTPHPSPTPMPTETPTPTPTPEPCDATINVGAIIYRGPSEDDLHKEATSMISPAPVIAIAYDEEVPPVAWYGVLDADPDRSGYPSWVKSTDTNVTLAGVGCTNLPDQSTQADNNWDDILPPVALAPLIQSSGSGFRGFGIPDVGQYSDNFHCQHPGFDFNGPLGADVNAIADGIVVGMASKYDNTDENGNLKLTRIDAWGATGGGYSVIVRTGNRFVLYGELGEIEDALYIGKRVVAGEKLGNLPFTGFPHVHIDIRGYGSSNSTDGLLRPRFGAINSELNGTYTPLFVVDLMAFVPNQGTSSSVPDTIPSNCPSGPGASYPHLSNSGASLGAMTFGFEANGDVYLGCFNTITGSPSSINQCVSQRPPQ